jgi:hypothetical protein
MEPISPGGVEKIMRAVFNRLSSPPNSMQKRRRSLMNSIIYLVGLVVIVMFVLSYFGLR